MKYFATYMLYLYCFSLVTQEEKPFCYNSFENEATTEWSDFLSVLLVFVFVFFLKEDVIFPLAFV